MPAYADPGYGYAAPPPAYHPANHPLYHPAYHAAYAAHAAGHCHIGYRWLNGYQTAVRICVTPLY
jgi:hypothetical protein